MRYARSGAVEGGDSVKRFRRWGIAVILVTIAVAAPAIAASALPVNPGLTNGDFEAGELSIGWSTGGAQNRSVTRVAADGNHMAKLEVGDGPAGDASCSEPSFNNFVFLDQLFTLSENRRVELDFLVPVSGISDPTEDAPCSGFDRVEIDFVLVDQNTFQSKLLGVALIDHFGATGDTIGHLQVNDFVSGTVSSTSFNPITFAPASVGPLSLTESTVMPGWLHASMDVDTLVFPWLPSQFTFRVTVRLEDNRFTSQDFSVSVDNVTTAESPGPNIAVRPEQGPALAMVSVDGSFFAGNEAGIQVTFDGVVVASGITADVHGAWQTTFQVPDVPVGDYVVAASGSVTTAQEVQEAIFTLIAATPIPSATTWGLAALAGLVFAVPLWRLRCSRRVR